MMAESQGTIATARLPRSDGAGQRGLVKVVLADDSPLMHLAMRAMLGAMNGFTVAAAARTVAEAEQLVLRTQPDLLVCDSDLDDECGISLCRWARRASPRTVAVILTARDDPQLAMSALAAGAAGYLLKATQPEELMGYLRAAARGQRVLDERLGRSALASAGPDRVAEYGLSPREREVLNEMLVGLGNQAIAGRLCIAEDTVKSHVKAIFRKLGARDRGHAIALALGTAVPAGNLGRPSGGPAFPVPRQAPRPPRAVMSATR